MRNVILLLVLSVCAATVHAQSPPDSTSQEHQLQVTVETLDWKRQDAMIRADFETLQGLMDPDMVYTHSIGLVQTRQQLFDLMSSGNAAYNKFTTHQVKWSVFGTTVVGTGTQTIDLTIEGRPVVSRSRFTVVWVNRGGKWKCVAYQSTPVPDLKESIMKE